MNSEPWKREDGTWMVPARVESEDGQTIGHGWQELTPDHPQYRDWVQYIAQMGDGWARRIADALPG